mmetsp:Transcript_19928/g.35531  ORF Transcript_19928/g.35531 Transcript_19928/m.35531 type:complete len:88 (+) Transcript_19928:519-782(+)
MFSVKGPKVAQLRDQGSKVAEFRVQKCPKVVVLSLQHFQMVSLSMKWIASVCMKAKHMFWCPGACKVMGCGFSMTASMKMLMFEAII